MKGTLEKWITLDLEKQGVQARIPVRQGDALVHKVAVRLTCGGKKYIPDGAVIAQIYALLPDGKLVSCDGKIGTTGEVTFIPGGDFFACGGPVLCRLSIRGDDGGELYSPAFAFDADPCFVADAPAVPAEEYSRFEGLLLRTLAAQKACEAVADEVREHIDAAIPTKLSELENDAGYIDEAELGSAVDTALAEVKESGGFDGENGVYVGSGDMPENANVQVDPEGADGELVIPDVLQTTGDSEEDTMSQKAITEEFIKRGQLKPEFANSVDELEESGDKTKLYVLPDGYMYAYMDAKVYTLTADDFVATTVNADGTLNEPTDYNNRIVTKSLWSLSTPISVSCPEPYQYFVYYYTDETEDTYIGKTAWKSGSIDDVTTDVVAEGTSDCAKYCRISLRDGTDTSANLTDRVAGFMNHIVVTRGNTNSKEWGNTGHAFVPADYEDRIVALEEALEGIEYGTY